MGFKQITSNGRGNKDTYNGASTSIVTDNNSSNKHQNIRIECRSIISFCTQYSNDNNN